MKTEDIYIAKLGYTTKVIMNGTLYDYYFGDGMEHLVNYIPMKYVIVKNETNGIYQINIVLRKILSSGTGSNDMASTPDVLSDGCSFVVADRSLQAHKRERANDKRSSVKIILFVIYPPFTYRYTRDHSSSATGFSDRQTPVTFSLAISLQRSSVFNCSAGRSIATQEVYPRWVTSAYPKAEMAGRFSLTICS